MGIMYKRALVITVITAGFVFSHTEKAIPSGLRLDDQRGSLGDRVQYTVWMEESPTVVLSFGFDLKYNPRVLRYLGSFYSGDLVGGFDVFDVSNPITGTLRAGGFMAEGGIPAGASGDVVTFEFEVIGRYDSSLSFSDLKDDFTWIRAESGEFTFTGPREESSTSNATLGEINNQSSNQESTSEAKSKTSTPPRPLEWESGAEENPFGSPITPPTRRGSKGDDEKPQTMARVWEPSREIPYSNKEKTGKTKRIDTPYGPTKSGIGKRAYESPSFGVNSLKAKEIEGEKVFYGGTVSERGNVSEGVLHAIFLFCFIGLAGIAIAWMFLYAEQRS